MAYPERKPIYDAYKSIVEKIINEKQFKQYAEAEIKALDNDLLDTFKSIRAMLLMNKKWPNEK